MDFEENLRSYFGEIDGQKIHFFGSIVSRYGPESLALSCIHEYIILGEFERCKLTFLWNMSIFKHISSLKHLS